MTSPNDDGKFKVFSKLYGAKCENEQQAALHQNAQYKPAFINTVFKIPTNTYWNMPMKLLTNLY